MWLLTRPEAGSFTSAFAKGASVIEMGVNSKRSVIPNPRSIEDRPVVVETRKRFGDWEVDTVLGKHGTGALVTLAEQKSHMYLAKRPDFAHFENQLVDY